MSVRTKFGIVGAMLAGLIAAFCLGVALGATMFAPCEHEDSSNCTWYGDQQGNGQGDTLTTIADLVVVWP